MSQQLSVKGKMVLGIVGVLVLFGGFWALDHFVPGVFEKKTTAASVPDQVKPVTGQVPETAVAPATGGQTFALPSAKPANVGGCKVQLWTIPWNATMGLQYANGGVNTTEGSLMAQNGVNLKLVRQDDYGKMQESMLKFAEGVKNGDKCPDGAAFVIIMGDGYSGFAAGLEGTMSKIGQGFEVAAAVGYSYGEDKCLLPNDVAVDKQKARGSLIGAVLRDGDYNICVTWASQNGIPINPDEKTYDPEAMNFVSVSAFTEADEKLITGYCEDRPVVKSGRKTGETKKICVNGTATWTPGDVNVAKQKGGLAAIASTREYAYQMPAIVIGNRDFMRQNPKLVQGLITAALKGSEAVRSSDKALTVAAAISAQVYNEQDPEYWKKYYKGVIEKDKLGKDVQLGGSRTIGFADNAFLFGLQGNDNLFKRIYKQFGDHNAKYYPALTPSYPAYDSVVNTSYLVSAMANAPETAASASAAPAYDSSKPIKNIVAQRSWTIEFDTGKATLKSASNATLEELLNQIAITNLKVKIDGHTDSVGNSDLNFKLSRARAEAVKRYLTVNAGSSFPDARVTVSGFGDTQPIADNGTADGKAKNRRVEVTLGN